MATAGTTKLEAVNRIMVAGYGLGRVSSLDSTGTWPNLTYGTSNHATAEFILDQSTRDVLAQNWGGSNMDYHMSFTVSGGQVDLSESGQNILAVRGNGDLTGRRLTIRNGFLYDQVANSNDGFGDGPIFLDVLRNVVWDECDPDVQSVALHRAIRYAKLDKLSPEQQVAVLELELKYATQGQQAMSLDRDQVPRISGFPYTAPTMMDVGAMGRR